MEAATFLKSGTWVPTWGLLLAQDATVHSTRKLQCGQNNQKSDLKATKAISVRATPTAINYG